MGQRIVLITGATGGLGTAVVEAFRAAGDQAIGVSRSSGEFAADLTRPDSAETMIRSVVERHGRIDVLVHTTGGFASGGSIPETGLDVWQRMMDMNFHAALYTVRAVLPHMTAAGKGRIVAVGSRAGVQLSAGVGAYSVSKAALHALIQTVALEVKDRGVTANVVLPSTIDTPANRSWGSPEQAALWVTPQSIAQVILWLASDAAADVNGALVPVYGQA
jgi:NAD(P)-dependent dehydrogenase (short-subunit alcohol dehydrogenase family)